MEESVSDFSKQYASSKKFMRKSNPQFEERKEDDEWLKNNYNLFQTSIILYKISVKITNINFSTSFKLYWP